MPQPSLADLLDPLIAAVVTEECPGGAVALDSTLPAVATEAQRGAIRNVARSPAAARAAGVTVAHCSVNRRHDGRGSNPNARSFDAGRTIGGNRTPGKPGGRYCPN